MLRLDAKTVPMNAGRYVEAVNGCSIRPDPNRT